jgi:hypothetical protein
MSRISCVRLGAGLLSLVVPFMMAGSVAAQPSASEVASVELACLALGSYDVHTCTGAVVEGLYGEREGAVNAGLAEQGLAYSIDLGDVAAGDEFGYDINEIAINPLPPVAATGEVLLPPSAVVAE